MLGAETVTVLLLSCARRSEELLPPFLSSMASSKLAEDTNTDKEAQILLM